MARRKDHSPEALRQLIHQSAEKIISSKGLKSLTARALADAIGYAPGTIYNFYTDMDALVTEINYATLESMVIFCRQHIRGLPPDWEKITALAHAYADFAHEHRSAWTTLFAPARKKGRMPKAYKKRLLESFQLIETTLQECLQMSSSEAHRVARLLWACLHGIIVLTLDGRLMLVGVEDPHDMINDLLKNYLSGYAPRK